MNVVIIAVNHRDPDDPFAPPSLPLRADGTIADRPLPDGRRLWVQPLTYNRAELALALAGDDLYFEDGWDYASPEAAVAAMALWDPTQQPEPDGWIRHPDSRRYRPDGDPAREYQKAAT